MNNDETHEQERVQQKRVLRKRKFPYLHVLERTLFDLQGVRIRSANRTEALLNTCKHCGMRKKRDEDSACQCFAPLVSLDQHTSLNSLVGKVADAMEVEIEKPIRAALKDAPIHEWLSGIKGIGPRISASLIALIDPIEGFETISSLWAYAGCDVVNGRGTCKNAMNDRRWNWELKCLVCGKIPTQIIKLGQVCTACERPIRAKPKPDKHCQCKKPKPIGNGFYRRYYDEIKAEYQRKNPEPVDSGRRTKPTATEPDGHPIMNYTPMHIERMTRRKLGKLVLAHLWLKWREMEGLRCHGLWVIEHGGHTTMIDPPESPE